MTETLKARRPYLLLLAVVVVLDQLTKRLVDRFLELHDSRSLIDGILSLTHVRNRGAAFGLFSDADLPYQAILFSVVSMGALFAIATYAWRLPAGHRLTQSALALIMGGAVGNLLDRVVRGYVTDFVDAYWGRHHWPAFNVADSAITVGVALLILDMIRAPRARESSRAEMAGAASPAGRSE